MYLCKFGKNPPIGKGDRVVKRLIFYSHYRLMTLNIRSRLPNLNNYLLCRNDTVYTLARIHHSVQEISCGNKILVKIGHFKVLV